MTGSVAKTTKNNDNNNNKTTCEGLSNGGTLQPPPSERCILGTKQLGGDGLAVRDGRLPVEVSRQDVGVKLLHVVVQFVAVNKHLRRRVIEWE